MKILYISNHNPYKTDTGGNQRGYLIFKSLCLLGDVDVLFIHSSKEPSIKDKNVKDCVLDEESKKFYTKRFAQLTKLFRMDASFIELPNKNSVLAFEEQIKNTNYDIIFFRYLKPYLECGMPMLSNMILDIDDLPWQNSKCMFRNKSYSIFKRLYHGYLYIRIKYHASYLFKKFIATLYVNKSDMRGVNSYYLPNIPCIKNTRTSTAITTTTTTMKDEYGILFVGTLSHVPNYEGLNHFIEHIWPVILKNMPNANLYIVGKGIPIKIKVRWEKVSHVNLLGFVDSLDDVYNSYPIVISPIYSGAGTNIKVLEALYYKRICLISQYSWRGFENTLKDNIDLIVCKSDQEFIDKLCMVLKNTKRYISIGEHGANQILKYYSEDTFAEELKKIVNIVRLN